MKNTGSHPAESKILALLDGELDPAEAAEVREHCEACEPCRRVRDELASVAKALRTGPDAEPIRPVWPAVKDRLDQERRPILRPLFGAAAAAAVAAGILLGVLVGSGESPPAAAAATGIWSVAGSSFTDDGVSGAYTGMGR